MVKFPSERFPPGFFDLPRGSGARLPIDIVERWTTGSQTRAVARELLEPHVVEGVVVSSDAAGLTRMTRDRTLVEILAMINRPKEFVHAWGRAVGGRAIGIWAADNTTMFYASQIPAERIVAMLLAMLDQVAADCEVQIGVGAHHGRFFELAGGLYGPDADRIELLAEEHTDGGELVVTDTLIERLGPAHPFGLQPRPDLVAAFGNVQRVVGGTRLTGVTPDDFRYPVPYSDEFYDGISQRNPLLPRPEYDRATVVLVERESEDPDIAEVKVLNNLALTAAMVRIGGELLAEHGGEAIKTFRLLSIYAFDDAGDAVAFAEALRATLTGAGIRCRIGVDRGPVLIFDLGNGGRDIAGDPVNTASKLAEDLGELGAIHVTARASAAAGVTGRGRPQRFAIAGVDTDVVVL
ncbi:MAG TPA: hypothetical protein VIS05_12475 [Ilumatobacter sp.]